MLSGKYRVLYFIAASAPTTAEDSDVLQYGPHVAYRNASRIHPDENLEECDAVAGCVPANYAAYYPAAVSFEDYQAGKLPGPPIPLDAGMDGPVDKEVDPFVAQRGAIRAPTADWTPQG